MARPPKVTKEQEDEVRRMRTELPRKEATYQKIADATGISVATVHHIVKRNGRYATAPEYIPSSGAAAD